MNDHPALFYNRQWCQAEQDSCEADNFRSSASASYHNRPINPLTDGVQSRVDQPRMTTDRASSRQPAFR
jgi:hypothetical protein